MERPYVGSQMYSKSVYLQQLLQGLRESAKNSGKTCKSCDILPRSLLQLDRNPDGFPKTLKIIRKTYVSAMVVAMDAMMSSSGTPGHTWDLHEKSLGNLVNPCLFVFGSATRGAFPKEPVATRPES